MKYTIFGTKVGKEFQPNTEYSVGEIEKFEGDESSVIKRSSELVNEGYCVLGICDENGNYVN